MCVTAVSCHNCFHLLTQVAALVYETVPSAGCTCNSVYSLAEKERDKGVEVVKESKKSAD